MRRRGRQSSFWLHLVFPLGFALLGTVGLLLIDLAWSNTTGYLCNGFWCLDRAKTFHIGLYLAFGSIWALLLRLLWEWWAE